MGFLYSQLFVTPPKPTTSCEGKTVIVTGSNTGLGKAAALHFAQLKASKVILAVRNTKAGQAAKEEIERISACKDDIIEVWDLDLSSYDSIKSFSKRASALPRIDILTENAGIATATVRMKNGHESTIMVNVIGTFLLALLMLPKLKASAKEFKTKPVLTIVTSEVHGWTKFPEGKEADIFGTLSNNPTKKAMKERYPTSKLLEVLVIRKIAPNLAGSNVSLNMVNPGLCHSELSREGGLIFVIMKALLARSTEVGSRNLVLASLAGPESNGKYISDGHIDEDAVSPFVRSSKGAEMSKKVWYELRSILEKVEPGVTSEFDSK